MTRDRNTPSLFASDQDDTDIPCSHVSQVAFDSAADTVFYYLVPDVLWPITPGRRVQAPFGRADKPQVGFCVSVDSANAPSLPPTVDRRRLKRITAVVDDQPLIDAQLMDLARWISTYYVCPLGQVLAATVPGPVKRGVGLRTEKLIYLPPGQSDSAERVTGPKQKRIIAMLTRQSAFSPESAVLVSALLEQVGCKDSPVKRLAEIGVIRITERTILAALPAIPRGLVLPAEHVTLNDDQQRALAAIKQHIDSGEFGVTLLHGVTDSGKTEVYIRAIAAVLKQNRKAIILLPEIALTAQTVQRFSARFDRIAVMHSGLTAAQRHDQWRKVRAGKADVVIGARSAIFAPIPDLGLIVVDEEHEPSYKQDTVPRYHGRDVAVKRAQLAGAHCILGSATPSLETLHNCRTRPSFDLQRLPKRVMDLPMPKTELVDLRYQPAVRSQTDLISEPLTKALREVLAKNEQAILLLNRRGYSSFVFCPSCGYSLRCRNCDVTLTFHRSKLPDPNRPATGSRTHFRQGRAVCHHCLAQTLVPRQCPLCSKPMTMIGLGSQKLEEELKAKFPEANVARIDSDSMAAKDYYRLLDDFSTGRINILAGTQILAKGLHFPNVTLVGIISADTALYLPDFRTNERTFQLISQVAGRAGRSEKSGIVLAQTFLPDQPAIRFAVAADFDGFVAEELKHRRACNLPPFWRLARVLLLDADFERLEAASAAMRNRIDAIVRTANLDVKVRGPMPPVIARLQRSHRMQIIIQAPEASTVQRLFAALRTASPLRPRVKIVIDIDPVNVL